MDVKAVFRLVDVDKSGSISRTVKVMNIFISNWNIIIAGGKNGDEVVNEEICYKGCKLYIKMIQ